jgi:hypothetical protein
MEGGAVQQIVDEAGREAHGQPRRHEERGAQPLRRIAEDAVSGIRTAHAVDRAQSPGVPLA